MGAALYIHADVAVQVELYPLGSPREGRAAGNPNELFQETHRSKDCSEKPWISFFNFPFPFLIWDTKNFPPKLKIPLSVLIKGYFPKLLPWVSELQRHILWLTHLTVHGGLAGISEFLTVPTYQTTKGAGDALGARKELLTLCQASVSPQTGRWV